MTCIIREFGCSCPDQCQDHWEVTKAKLIDLDKRHEEQRRRDDAWLRRNVIRASLAILIGLAAGLAFVHADEKFAQQAKIEAV